MTTVVDINDVAKLKGLLALAREGDDIFIEENGRRLAKVVPSGKSPRNVPILGLREGQGWVAEDFDAELPDSFWLSEDK
jgi:antitoxin (DNA-binding transcriptional repressor) of toxin-antitoxin stability system